METIMRTVMRRIRFGMTAIFMLVALVATGSHFVLAQPAQEPLALATIKALQEALNQQGISVTADGMLNDATRAAIRKYQSQHHLPVTGDPDKATLNKLGVVDRQGATSSQSETLSQMPPGPNTQPQSQAQMMQGGMMNCAMMQGDMQMMQGQMQQMMRGMMQMMQGMKGQTPPAGR
jgi:lysozyme family protein